MDADCLLDLVRRNEHTLFVEYFPRWKQIIAPIYDKYLRLCQMIDEKYEKLRGVQSPQVYRM